MAATMPLTLAQAITPSREACNALKAKSNPSRSTRIMGKSSHSRTDDDNSSCSDFVSPPPRNSTEQREWDRMSTRMSMFHTHFRQTFARVWQMSEKVSPDELQDFLDCAEEFVRSLLFLGDPAGSTAIFISVLSVQVHHLEGHHGIEERYIFPVLAKKMPEFRVSLLSDRGMIHAGMDRYQDYIRAARATPTAFSPEKLREIMGSMGPILFYHLDAEVETLKADNLRRCELSPSISTLPQRRIPNLVSVHRLYA
ncbi:BZ3500_MvSof-1268-A1-R1_Chr9g10538 [Microbotryum saponariae]|uniref:BZ3500_MvSof-1268-A1-R1_Chr9g10538 protein n=1 Tax=Microbotryum saponariae TaxID=289078 RepID=A0A2X0L5W0_9BASI|nr:BZ3501_MvSof-1269-A2-R1_Chr9g10287 [Microbotryum saponariae]SDA00260.1 BZ3500_MvSof-1268-A1-R1_Chr9g10538 [Microbotryum saponariae]